MDKVEKLNVWLPSKAILPGNDAGASHGMKEAMVKAHQPKTIEGRSQLCRHAWALFSSPHQGFRDDKTRPFYTDGFWMHESATSKIQYVVLKMRAGQVGPREERQTEKSPSLYPSNLAWSAFPGIYRSKAPAFKPSFPHYFRACEAHFKSA